SVRSSAAARLDLLDQDTLAECRPIGLGKPCWLTEWGLPADSARGCAGNDASQAVLIAELMADFRQFVQQGRLTGLIYYAWSDDKYGIFRCGALTTSMAHPAVPG